MVAASRSLQKKKKIRFWHQMTEITSFSHSMPFNQQQPLSAQVNTTLEDTMLDAEQGAVQSA